MKKISMTMPAGILAAAVLAGACGGQRSVTPQSVPSRGGFALTDAMAAQCADEAAGLAARLAKDPSLATNGIEVRVPSSQYRACLTDMLLNQTGMSYVFTPIEGSAYETLKAAPQQ